MTTLRVSHSKNYTCIANQAIQDRALSFKARGLHHLLLSYPDNWVVNTEQLVKESDRDGKDAIGAGLRELEKAGYITRTRVRDPKTGRLDWESVIRELPINGKPGYGENEQKRGRKRKNKGQPTTGFTSDGSPSDGSPSDGSPSDGKPGHIISTDQTSTDQTSTKEQVLTIDRVTSKKSAASLDAIAHTPQTIDILAEPVSGSPSPRKTTEQVSPVQPELSGETAIPPAPKNSKKRKIKHIPDQEPEAFQMFWDTYYAFCLDVNCSAGVRAAAVQSWDALLPTIERSDLEEGTAYYIQKKREQFVTKGEAIGVSHCCRFLRDLKWQEALDHKRRGDIQPVMTLGNRRAMQTYQAGMSAIKDL